MSTFTGGSPEQWEEFQSITICRTDEGNFRVTKGGQVILFEKLENLAASLDSLIPRLEL